MTAGLERRAGERKGQLSGFSPGHCQYNRVDGGGQSSPRSLRPVMRWWERRAAGPCSDPGDTAHTEQRELRTTVRYPVHCGPRQLASYLTDMGALVFEVLTQLDHLPIGRAQISNISHLSPTHPLSGFFPVVSPTSERLGELQVSVALEPLHDDSSSVLHSNISQDIRHQPKVEPVKPLRLSADHRDSGSSRVSTPGAETTYTSRKMQKPNGGVVEGSQSAHTSHYVPSKDKMAVIPTTEEGSSYQPNVNTEPAAKDLLKALLDQGSKLRDAMVESALRLDPRWTLMQTQYCPLYWVKDITVSKLPGQHHRASLHTLIKTCCISTNLCKVMIF
ncbi:unnamed protein product [Ranitomeya imitator]|uniref:C2CD3 N-terminal C2 domain-containing protein n=1 Tax=Ranitomeya imitator TaxID=111125 RepID=A0ABN9MC23_9NEOB|nr:unnamed protein product [Ranitomeya imitator]